MKRRILSLFIILINLSIVVSQDNIVKISGDDLITDYLKESKNNYLVYIENENGVIMDISIWERSVSFSKKENQEIIIVEQRWKNQDSTRSRNIYSINKKENFYPIYHFVKNGDGKKDAFDFTENNIKGTDSVHQNSKRDFFLKLEAPVFNWELDLEILQCLPYEKNKTFRINFYHPGSRKGPDFYDYKVIGDELIDLGFGTKTDCWLLKITRNEKNHSIFWINKKSKEVLKMVEVWNKIKRYKIKFHN